MAPRFVRTGKVDGHFGRKGRKPKPGPRRMMWPTRPLNVVRSWKGGFYARLGRAERFQASCPSGQGPGSKPEDAGSIPAEATTTREGHMHD